MYRLITSTIVSRLSTAALLLATLAGNCMAAWAAGSLVGTNFKGATLKGAKFANQNLQGAIFGAGDGGGQVDFSGANLDKTCFADASGLGGADLTYASFHCADFSNTVWLTPCSGRCKTSAPTPNAAPASPAPPCASAPSA